MVWKTVGNRTASVAFMGIKNVSGAGSLTQNAPAVICIDGSSVDGVNATHPYTAGLLSWVGIMDKTCPINGYRLAQVWGYRGSALFSGEGSDVTVTAGDLVHPVAGTGLGLSSIGGETHSELTIKACKAICVSATVQCTAAAYGKVFLQCVM